MNDRMPPSMYRPAPPHPHHAHGVHPGPLRAPVLPPAPGPTRWCALAVLAAVCVVVCAPAAVVLGVVARRRIRRTGERGRRLATIAVVLGAIGTALAAALVVLVVASGAVSFHAHAGPQLSGSTVASSIVEQSSGRAREVTCPDDLPGTVGASVTCSAVIDGAPGTVRATTTGVRGDRILFDLAQV